MSGTVSIQVRTARKSDRGVALILTLLLLGLLSVMTLGMVIATNSDSLINGYYRNFRGAFYASDSGLNVVRQSMLNQLSAAVPATFSLTTQPISAAAAAAIPSAISSTYGGSYSSLNGGQAASSWPGSFKISTATLTLANCLVIGGGGTCAAPTGAVTGYHYTYNYTLTALGQARGGQQTTIDDSGSFLVNVDKGGASTTSSSFAAWSMFFDQFSICSAYLVPGTVTGPVFTNASWTFSDVGSYIFTDSVSSAGANAGYYFTSTNPQNCAQSPTTSFKYKGKTISPTFQGGLNLAQAALPLPANDFSQKRAVLDGLGGGTDPTNAEMNSVLKKANGSAWPATGAASGVYVPYSVDPISGAKTFTGGGIYVKGNASVTLAATTQSVTGHSLQVFNITQGSGGGAVTTTVTLDLTGNTTTVTDSGGNSSGAISGLPQDLVNSPPAEGAMLYVDGSITSLSTQSGQSAAIQDASAVTITAASNVAITGDIKYKTEPVTLTQNQIPGTPVDTLIPGNDHGQVLGIFTANGDIQLVPSANNINMEIDASLATIKSSGSGGLINTTSNTINTLNIVGGRIANQIKNINATQRNVYFDRRFSQGGFAPPWFPSTTVTTTGAPTTIVTPSTQRVQWVNQTAY
jgi:Tfp pilus assembly protein PilX